MNYAEVSAAWADAKPDSEIRVNVDGAEYVVTSAGIEYDLGDHVDPADIDVNAADAPPGEQRRQVAAARMADRDRVMFCDGNCTEHRPMLTDRRVLWLVTEKA